MFLQNPALFSLADAEDKLKRDVEVLSQLLADANAKGFNSDHNALRKGEFIKTIIGQLLCN